MRAFANLLDRLATEPARNAKLKLLEAYFRATPDPARGYALAAMTGDLVFPQAKAGLVRGLMAERCDPVLFALSYDFVGDLAETVALLWQAPAAPAHSPALDEVVTALGGVGKLALPRQVAAWLDGLDETGRWALLKLITGALRIGVSARLAKTALAKLREGVEPDDIEHVWHGLRPPYAALFDWLDGRADKPETRDPAPFRPPMLAHALDEAELAAMDPAEFCAEWKWDGIRVQAVAGREPDGARVVKLYSRSGDDITRAFPDLADALAMTDGDFALDGELLVVRAGAVQSFGVLQQRLNRKTASAKLLAEFPAHLRAYDLLAQGGEDLRALPFAKRRLRLEALVAALGEARVSLSPQVAFAAWDELAALRRDPAGPDAAAVEGLMLKRRDSAYVPGRPKGLWHKWKREPFNADCVMMYAQRGHGKRSSLYSDYTFGCWADGELVPVGKAYSGFTDEELARLDKFVRDNTTNRFGPVREVARTLVLEIAFEGLNRSTRHKSGLAMRFPRVARIRWDKAAGEADTVEGLGRLLGEAARD